MLRVRRKSILIVGFAILGIAILGIGVAALAGAFNQAVRSNPTNQNTIRIFHSNPILGSRPSFVTGASGFLAFNGYAYSYVTLNTNDAIGTSFTVLPSINSEVPSMSNFNMTVTYEGGNTFDYLFSAVNMNVTITYTPFSTSFGDSMPVSGVAFFTSYEGSSSDLTVYFYIGPINMPFSPTV